jgi:hypothetical protein
MEITGQDLRPVEALWLLDREGEQTWTRESSLRAVLVDLATRGLLEPEEDDETFEPTSQSPDVELREYEEEVLDAVEGEDDQQEMVEAVYDFDFESFFIENGVLVENKQNKDITILSYTLYEWTNASIEESGDYDTLIAEILETEGDLRVDFENGELKSNTVPMVFAFQESDWFSDFEDADIEELVIDPDDIDVDTSSVATAGGSYVATNPEVMSAASSAGTACASSAAATCGAGAGAAAGGATGGV